MHCKVLFPEALAREWIYKNSWKGWTRKVGGLCHPLLPPASGIFFKSLPSIRWCCQTHFCPVFTNVLPIYKHINMLPNLHACFSNAWLMLMKKYMRGVHVWLFPNSSRNIQAWYKIETNTFIIITGLGCLCPVVHGTNFPRVFHWSAFLTG